MPTAARPQLTAPPPEREFETRGTAKGKAASFLARHHFMIVFALMSTFMGASVGVAQIATSLFAVSLGSKEATLGLIAGSQSVGMLVMSLPCGVLVDRFGPSRVFLFGSAGGCALFTMMGFVATSTGLLLTTTALGFFMPMRFVSLNTVFLRQLATLGEARAGWYRGTHMIGMFLVGPLVAARAIGWLGFVGTYLAVAGAFGLTALTSGFVFRFYCAGPEAAEGSRWHTIKGQLALLVRDRQLRALSLLEATNQAVGAYFTFFIVVIAVSVTGLGVASASSLVSAQGLTYIVALFLLGGVVERFGPRRASQTSLVLVVGALLILGCATRPASLWLGSLAIGLGLGMLQIANLTGYSRAGRRAGHGKVSGLNALAGPAGGLSGSLCGGVVGGAIGLQAVFFVFAGALGLASLPFLWRWVRTSSIPVIREREN